MEWPVNRVSKRKGGQWLVVRSNGSPHSRSATAREERENGQVLNSPWLKGCFEVVGNDVVMLQVNQHGKGEKKEFFIFFLPPCGCRSRWPDMGDGRS